ncbi:MAG: molybdopterin-binding/glycosyltransferase family 2 protein [Pseudomonadota bacterium]
MNFATLPLDLVEGAILAHSLQLSDGRLAKGVVLDASAIARLRGAGLDQVTVARLDADDVGEDAAAARLGSALAPHPATLGLHRAAAFTGRLNLYAATAGLLRVDAAMVTALNSIHPALTLATLEDATWVAERQMVGTVKIIPYAAPETAIAAAERRLSRATPALQVHPPAVRRAGLVLTVTRGMKQSVVDKGAAAVRTRLIALGLTLAEERRVPHEVDAVAGALGEIDGEIVLMLTASATSDPADVGPAALMAAGGRLERFGMPVDPGNLLFIGEAAGRSVIGLPGCARSPKPNGADWVLARVVAGQAPDAAEIAAMGVGGLLKEIPARPAPRAAADRAEASAGDARPRVSALLLAAGASRRMAGRDKLIEVIDGQAVLRLQAEALLKSGVEEVVVVLRPDAPARRAALADLPLRLIENPRAEEGMGASLAAGMAALDPRADAVLIALADMPELTAEDHARLLAAFDPGEGREIIRATAADGTPGHPVLFGRRFFEPLAMAAGDEGARRVVAEHGDYAVRVPLPALRATTDLDTPEEWSAWRAARGASA